MDNAEKLLMKDIDELAKAIVEHLLFAKKTMQLELPAEYKKELDIKSVNNFKANIIKNIHLIYAYIMLRSEKNDESLISSEDLTDYMRHDKLSNDIPFDIYKIAVSELVGKWYLDQTKKPTVNQKFRFYKIYYQYVAHLVPDEIRNKLDLSSMVLIKDTIFNIFDEHRNYFDKIIIEKQNKGKSKRRRITIDLIKKAVNNLNNKELIDLAKLDKPYKRAKKIQTLIQLSGSVENMSNIGSLPTSRKRRTIVNNWPQAWEELKVERNISE